MIFCKIRGFNLVHSFAEITLVSIFCLHSGSWSIILTSNSPKKAKAIERGIGVAVICNMWGELNFLNTALCLTPNLCCSSIQTNIKFLKSTSSCNTAWVVTNTSIFHSFKSDFILVFSLFVKEPVNNSTRNHSGNKNLAKVLKCWLAKTSSGANKTDWPWNCFRIYRIAIVATIVFPLPTSHCNKRSIGLFLWKSSKIWIITFFWATVNWNGSKSVIGFKISRWGFSFIGKSSIVHW